MTIALQNSVLKNDLNAGDLKTALHSLLNKLEEIDNDQSISLNYEERPIITNADLSGMIGKWMPTIDGDNDLNGDGIPDNIPPHMVPYVRTISRLRAENSVLRNRTLDSHILTGQLTQFAQNLATGSLSISNI